MDIQDIASTSARLIHSGYMKWKFDLLEKKALEHDLSVEDLKNSDERFALYMRVGRAFETCSHRDSIDFIADAMIGGIKKGDIDTQPDKVHMAVGALTGVTNTELSILVIMEKHKYYFDESGYPKGENQKENYEQDACTVLGIDTFRLGTLTNSLMRTGLVTPPAMGYGSYVQNTNSLTPLARDLFDYVYYVRTPQ